MAKEIFFIVANPAADTLTEGTRLWFDPAHVQPGSLNFWRERVLLTLLLTFVCLGVVVYLPLIILSAPEGYWEVFVLDAVFYLVACALLFFRQPSLQLRATLAVSLLYCGGLYLVARVGPLSGGPLWLFAFPVMTGVLLGIRPALFALVLNFFTIIVLGKMMWEQVFAWPEIYNYGPGVWAIIATNLFLLNAAVTLSLAVLLRGLDSAFTQERIISSALTAERQHLLEANERLERAMQERQEAEQARVRLEQAIAQAAEVFVITDLDGRITYANPALERVTGYSPEHVEGRNFQIFFTTPSAEKTLREMWIALRQGEVWAGSARSVRRDGRSYEAELTCSPVYDKPGKPVAFLAVMRDITRERQLEGRLRQTQKLEAIGTLAGGIAHDFNNILVPILGFGEMLKKTLPEGSLEQQRAERIVTASERGRDLVRHILTFSRQMEVTKQRAQLDQIVLEALVLLRPMAPHHVDVQHDLAADCPPMLADPTQLHQVVMNLCTNGCHAMEHTGGELRVSLRMVEPGSAEHEAQGAARLDPAQRYLRLSVRDTGMGMDSHTCERMFDPFFTTKSDGRGTGLGLATVHGIVTELHGAISVESELGRGTTFTVYLPAAASVEAQEQLREQSDGMKNHLRVMLVDDEELVASCAQEMARSLGYEVTAFTNPREALAHLNEHPDEYDVLVTDQTMAGLNGLQLAEAAGRVQEGLVRVIVTGYSELLTRDALDRAGVRRVLQKPFTREELGLALSEVVEGERELAGV